MIYATLYRIWGKVRLHYVKQWEMAPAPRGGSRPYWWGGVGKACDRAMWQHCLKDEIAGSLKLGTATAVTDGHKFYEHVEHGLLLKASREFDYPKRVMRLNLDMYKAQRRCSLAGSFSEPVEDTRFIGAG